MSGMKMSYSGSLQEAIQQTKMSVWTTKEIAQQRYDICKTCDYFIKVTSQCDLCKCFMKLKVKLTTSECPNGLWNKEPVS